MAMICILGGEKAQRERKSERLTSHEPSFFT